MLILHNLPKSQSTNAGSVKMAKHQAVNHIN